MADKEGRATVLLAERIGHGRDRSGLRVLAGALQRAERAGVIEREVRGRRTFRIALAEQASAQADGAGAVDEGVAGMVGSGPLDELAERIVAAGIRRWTEADGLRRELDDARETNEALTVKLAQAAAKVRKLQAENRRLRRTTGITAEPGGETAGTDRSRQSRRQSTRPR